MANLARRATRENARALIGYLADQDPILRDAAEDALVTFEGAALPAVTRWLIEAGDRAAVRETAVRLVTRMRDPGKVAAVLDAFRGGSRAEKAAIYTVLAHLGWKPSAAADRVTFACQAGAWKDAAEEASAAPEVVRASVEQLAAGLVPEMPDARRCGEAVLELSRFDLCRCRCWRPWAGWGDLLREEQIAIPALDPWTGEGRHIDHYETSTTIIDSRSDLRLRAQAELARLRQTRRAE